MKKWSLTVAILLTTFVVGYFMFKPKPLVERLDDPETMPVWQCPGCSVGVSVVYVDRRNHQKVTYFYDSGQDGAVDTVVDVLSGYYESRIEIVDDEEEAEEWNSRSRREKWNDGRKWFWREADEVKPFQNKYEEIRKIYQHLHSSLKLAENQSQPKPPISHKKIELFQRLLTEYRRQDGFVPKVWGRDAHNCSKSRNHSENINWN